MLTYWWFQMDDGKTTCKDKHTLGKYTQDSKNECPKKLNYVHNDYSSEYDKR